MKVARGVAVLVGLVLVLAACGGTQRTAGPGIKAQWYVVRFKSATLSARRPDGSAWHVSSGDNTAVMLGGLVGLAVGNPSLGMDLGKAMSNGGGDPLAPAPYVELKIGQLKEHVAATERTYSPSWAYQPIEINARGLAERELVIVQVKDALDESLIAQTELSFADFIARPSHTFTNLGAVAMLEVDVEPATARQRAVYELVVPDDASLEGLLRGEADGWRPIPIWNGDKVTISAVGKVCPSTISDDCFGPDGAETDRWTSYNYADFKDSAHAALVGVVPGGRVDVGSSRMLRIPQSGQLLLFINDTDAGNNSGGGFRVDVVVEPPE